MSTEINNTIIIGSGNIAWHLANAFSIKGIRIMQILARNEKTAAKISKSFSIPYITDSAKLVRNADLYILAVQDDQIKDVSQRLHLDKELLVHTSGFSSIEILSGVSKNTGVLWPLQTLTAGKAVDYQKIPFFIEGNSKSSTEKLARFAGLVSDRVMVTDSPTRQRIHLAAVIASNLTNQLYAISASILERQDIPFDVLAPLITETAIKAGLQHPLKSRTGPAARKDIMVIEKHLDLLRDDPQFRDIYRLITENIIHHRLK